jgi:hypothetical protein
MNIFARNDLQTLIQHREQPCLSLYMPTERAGKETRQNAIRFKDMLSAAEEQLTATGSMNEEDARTFLQPAKELLGNDTFWQHQSDGLAIFRSPELFQAYRLPLSFDELVTTTDRFHIKPLLSLFTGNGRFYVLALSQHTARLLQGTRFSVEELELPEDTPTSIEEVTETDDPERQLQGHTAGSIASPTGTQGAGTPLYHGHADEDDRVNRLRYFLEVDRGVQEVLKEEQAPLVLVGVEEHQGLYRERNTYKNLIEEGVHHNPDLLKPEELHAHAWEAVEPHMQRAQQEAIDRYHQNVPRDLASNDLHQVVPASVYGRVDSLFVAVGLQQWGIFNSQDSTVYVHQEAEPGDEDLLDTAAANTVMNSGTVYAVNPDEVPGDGLVAAIYRY